MKLPALYGFGLLLAWAATGPVFPAAHAATAQDAAGAHDYAELARYPQARIRAYRALSNAEIIVPRGSLSSLTDEAEKVTRLQGAITHTDYVLHTAIPAQEMDRYYETQLRGAGYETVFHCVGISACGSRMGSLILNDGNVAPAGFASVLFNDQLRVRVARKGATWIVLHMIQGPDRALTYQAVIEAASELE